ncbi:MAG: serine/threonine protein kinase [Candidatus Obscuribacterales bacterium]|nr:serine/threonine protein kinase [Candidatus Obscuribacterales bacterium]
MTLDGQNNERPYTDVDIERITTPPTRVQLAAIMSEAEESAPHSQEIRFALSDGSIYLLTVTYLSRTAGEPTWILTTDKEDPPVVFWSIETENPEQIYNLILKRARNPSTRPSQTTADFERPAAKAAHITYEGLRNLPTPQPSGYFFADRYEVIEEIGCGGMSRVYRAHDQRKDEQVAVKVLHAHLLRENTAKNPKKRFEQEFKATMALAHNNIVAVKDHGFTAEGLPFMVMEFIDGHSLEQLLRANSRLRLSEFLTVFYQTCRALSHAHVRGVIHRDVKPSNIMMLKTEQNVSLVKLLDFGIAKIQRETEESMQKLTQTGDVFGSPYYMSPEQCRGEPLDARSDIYSLGCVMYQAITGKRPFEGENAYKTIYMHVNIKPASFDTVRPDVSIPEKLEKIVMKCLEKDPRKRYQTSEEVSLEIQKLAQEDQIEDEKSFATRQTKSGTIYAVHVSTGKEEPANVVSVLKLLLHAGIIGNDEYAKASTLENPQSGDIGKFLVAKGYIDNKTLHAAVQCQSLIEKGDLKIEKAIIALHYCQRSRIGLKEALDELGWKTGTSK